MSGSPRVFSVGAFQLLSVPISFWVRDLQRASLEVCFGVKFFGDFCLLSFHFSDGYVDVCIVQGILIYPLPLAKLSKNCKFNIGEFIGHW